MEFTVTNISADAASKNIIISTNFPINENSVDDKTIEIMKVICNKDGEEIRKEKVGFNCKVDKKDIIVELITKPSVNDKYYVFVKDLVDKLKRNLLSPYDKYISFEYSITSTLTIQAPSNHTSFKTKNVEFTIAILDEDGNNQNNLENNNSSNMAIFNDEYRYKILIAKDPVFFNFDYIYINKDGSIENPNRIKYSLIDVNVQPDKLSFKLLFDKDSQYYVKARVEKSETVFGIWSEYVEFIVKAEDLLNEDESFMDSMLFTDELFKDAYKPLEVVSRSEDAFTPKEFYLEFNKPICYTEKEDEEVDDDGLVYVGKAYLIRRDL